MTVLGVDPDAVRHQADLLEGSADDLRRLHLDVPETGGVNGRTEDGLRLVEHRAAAVAEQLMVTAITMRRLAGFYPEVDDAVAQSLRPGGS